MLAGHVARQAPVGHNVLDAKQDTWSFSPLAKPDLVRASTALFASVFLSGTNFPAPLCSMLGLAHQIFSFLFAGHVARQRPMEHYVLETPTEPDTLV